ncbi:MAG TPA: glutaredoxin domain-containing protein [Terriglobales bacterium]|nr:glutaredoxin domain-containing protein [Terriglobales bacterium]
MASPHVAACGLACCHCLEPAHAVAHPYSAMDLTIYTAFWCPDSREAKRFLQRHKVAYKEIDIETTPGAAEEVIRRTGK